MHWIVWVSLLVSGQANAGVLKVNILGSLQRGPFALGIGSSVTLEYSPQKRAVPGIFLGRLVNNDGTSTRNLFFDIPHSQLLMIDQNDVEVQNVSNALSDEQLVLQQYDQVGGTCTGYAIDHYWEQVFWSGFQGNGSLRQILSTEKGRTQLLVSTINEYYLVAQHRFSLLGVMKHFADPYGYRCEKKTYTDSESAIQYVLAQVALGKPVMISFVTSTQMSDTDYTISDYEHPTQTFDKRLWGPRRIGDRASGGHTVVAVSNFEANHRQKLLMLDSDWSEPRIWDIEQFLDNHTAIQEIEFYTCI